MRALVLEKPGRPPVLAVREVPRPAPGPGEVLVKVAACGFCHHDLLIMAGTLRRGVRPGVILGHEIAGTVAEVGPGVHSLRPGDIVVSILTSACGGCDRCQAGSEHRCLNGQGIGHGRNGGFAEYVAISEFSLVPLLPSTNLTRAALFACPIGVALQAAQQVAGTQPGETMLVTGAGGGLGIHAVQVGAMLGANVLAVSTSPEKLEYLAGLDGVTPLEHGSLDFSELALALTEERGAEVIIDTVGSPLFPSTLRCLAQYGRLALLGEVSAASVSLNLAELIFRDARMLGASGVSRLVVRQVAEAVAQGKLSPVVSRVLPLEQAAQAFQYLSERSVLGRIVIVP